MKRVRIQNGSRTYALSLNAFFSCNALILHFFSPPDPITTLSGVTAILASSFNGILKENGYSPGCLVDLKNQVAIANEEIKVLKEENKSLARQLHAQKERCKSLEMIHTTSHTAHSSIQTKLEESTKEISSLRTENSELFTQRRDAHSHVHRL